jgi:hypothetical protein
MAPWAAIAAAHRGQAGFRLTRDSSGRARGRSLRGRVVWGRLNKRLYVRRVWKMGPESPVFKDDSPKDGLHRLVAVSLYKGGLNSAGLDCLAQDLSRFMTL